MSCNEILCSMWDECDKILGSELKPLCASEIKEVQPASAQQLKAEIAALVQAYDTTSSVRYSTQNIDTVINKLRQLSAV